MGVREPAHARGLLNFLNGSPTAFHAADNSAEILKGAGFAELSEGRAWALKKGGKYYMRRNGSSLVAFEIGSSFAKKGFRIVGAHTDSPCFKLKPGDAVVTNDGYVTLNTECYGGAIVSTWFDRPLSIAGRVTAKGAAGGVVERVFNVERPMVIIPSLCSHLNREAEGHAPGKQADTFPLLGLTDATARGDYLLNIISIYAGIPKNRVLDYDLFLYENDKGQLMGANGEFVSASRLDNLWMVFAGLQAMIGSGKSASTKVFAAFDNEEVGSATMAGANSMFLNDVLRRVCAVSGMGVEETQIAMANSTAVSADCAHAVHPNHGNRHDPVNRPVLGGGMAIKYSAAQKYGTNASTAAMFAEICERFKIPYQKYVNRSDTAGGGSTIGPALSCLASVPTVDVGIPILAMHSIREFGCLQDNKFAIDALSKYYSA